jgi:protein-tyrosine-phosphatase/DNA-binding transcriptional ArsR family regulator
MSIPPQFFALASHPLRWQLLRELVRSDCTVRELTALLAEPQNLVSYHLRLLRESGLVTPRRSSADGRDTFYVVDLAACREALQAAGAALHPLLRLAVPDGPLGVRPTVAADKRRRRRVLFLCTGNSARSQMAEALVEKMSDGQVAAASAGSAPKPLHPNAVRAMRRYDIDISGRRTKHFDEFRSQRFDAVITLCDRVKLVRPEFPHRPELVHWSVPDPSLELANERASFPAFERTAAELHTRIGFRLPMLIDPRAGEPAGKGKESTR